MNIDKAKPILFSMPEVQAILAGRKTQTRRAINHLPHCPVHGIDPYFTSGVLLCKGCDHFPIYPKYKPGDILWVRETWRSTGVTSKPYAYRADEEDMVLIGETGNWLNLRYRYKPSIYMPREATRIFLRVIDVRVERVQAIKYADVSAELGSEFPEMGDDQIRRDIKRNQLKLFHRLWDNTYAKRGYGWNTNPWGWVYTFERVVEE